MLETKDKPVKRQNKGGRPKIDPGFLRGSTVGVRVSADEYTALRAKAAQMGMTPAQWLREAGLTRRLPSPPVPAINREQYAELARLSGNFNQLARAANESRVVVVDGSLLQQVSHEVARLRQALIGVDGGA